MKLIHPFIIAPMAVTGAALAAFTVPWSTLDGGGGTSTGTTSSGAVLSLSGTIGQFDVTASPASGGAYDLNGGFWAEAVALPEFANQLLQIVRLPSGDASIQWSSNAVGWQMESSMDLIHWSPLGATIANAGALTVPHTPGVPKRFFRLRFP